jgi:acyl-coenzyme A synthetase/AMP-(fatty) acid ligase
LEQAVEPVPGIRKGCVVAFGVQDAQAGTEAIVVVAESREPSEAWPALEARVAAAVDQQVGIKPDVVCIVPPGAIPKTSSGKLQRQLCRARFEAGTLVPDRPPGTWDKIQLVAQAWSHRLRAD